MNEPEAVILVTWLNQTDRRITTADATVQVWASILVDVPFEPAKAAVIEHYRLNGDKQPDPRGIRAIAYDLRNRAVARQTALTAAPATGDVDYEKVYVKHVNRPEFQAAVDRGRREGNAHRAYQTTYRDTGSKTAAAEAAKAARDAS